MTNKVVFITGSAKRIGAHTAEYLHQIGFNVVLHCHRSIEHAQALRDQLNSRRKQSAALVIGDLCEQSSLQNIAQQATDAFGRIDALVNNASSFYPTPLASLNDQDWDSLMGSNAKAPLYLCALLQKQLEMNQGVVINMVDIHAQRPLRSHTVYCMAKAALVTMTQSLAQEMAPNVRVNAVAPGAILWPEKPLEDGDKQAILKQIPLGRLGTEQDIAEAIGFLLNAPYITGQIVAVDGGRSIANSSKA